MSAVPAFQDHAYDADTSEPRYQPETTSEYALYFASRSFSTAAVIAALDVVISSTVASFGAYQPESGMYVPSQTCIPALRAPESNGVITSAGAPAGPLALSTPGTPEG